MGNFSAISCWEQVTFQWDDVHFVLDPLLIFILLAHLNSNVCVDMLLHSVILSWFWANQFLFLFLEVECYIEMQQIPILYSLVWPVMTFAGICSFSVKMLQLFVVVYVYLLICQFIGMIIDPGYPLTNQYYISVCKFYFVENVGTCLATIFKIKWFLRNILYSHFDTPFQDL